MAAVESKRARGRRLQRERAANARRAAIQQLRTYGAEVLIYAPPLPRLPIIHWSGLPPKARGGITGGEYLWT